MDVAALVGGRENVLTNGHKSEQVSKSVTVQEACKGRSRLRLHCCRGWSDDVMWLGKSDRSEQRLIWCSGVMSLVHYSSKLRRKGKSVPISPDPADKATHELTYTSFRNWCGFCVRARAADDPHHRQPDKES